MANYTEHYQLHQWEPEDSFLRTDFNQDLSKIDTTLGELAEAAAQVAKLGNCEISHTTYTGSNEHSRTLTFPGKPMVVMVARADDGSCFIAWRGMQIVLPHHQQYGTAKVSLSWGNDTLTWSFTSNLDWAMNVSGVTYQVIALLDMSA